MDDNSKQNLPRRRTVVPGNVSIIPRLDTLLSDATITIGNQLVHYRIKTDNGAILNEKEAAILRNLIDSLVKMSKEAREAAKSEDLSNLSDKELLELVEQLVLKNK